MAGFEIYQAHEQAPPDQALPQISGGEQTAAALSNAGTALNTFAKQMETAQAHTEKSNALTGYLSGVDQAEQAADQSTDYKSVAASHKDTLDKLTQDTLGQVSNPVERAALQTQLTRLNISSLSTVRQKALVRESDQNVASLDAQATPLMNQWMNAGSEAEKQSVRDVYAKQIDDTVASRFLTAQQGEAKKAAFDKATQYTDAYRDIRLNPQAAVTKLQDPANFPSLAPEQRESLIRNAQSDYDQQSVLRLGEEAKRNPLAAVATVALSGRPVTDDQGRQIFSKIIDQESGGKARALSVDGAAGIAQVMPGTARAMATAIGRPDVAKMSDAEVTAAQRADPKLSYALGSAYFQQNLAAFGGRLGPTIASYHAGPAGAVKTAFNEAKAKYGDGFTDEQFRQLLPDSLQDGNGKKTKDYVTDIFRRLGADPSAPPISVRASFSASQAVQSELQSQEAEKTRILNQQVALNQPVTQNTIDNLKAGNQVEPEQLAQISQTLAAAAGRGNADAARTMREVDYATAIRPVINDLFRQPVAVAEAQVTAEESRLAGQGSFSTFEKERLDTMKTTLGAMKAGAANDPVGLAARAGYVQPQPLVPGQDLTAIGPNVAQRAVDAGRAQQVYGTDFKFFRPEEKAAWQAAYNSASPDDKAHIVATFGAAGGQAGMRAIQEIAGDTATGRAAAGLFGVAPDIATSLIKGDAALKVNDGYLPNKGPNKTLYETQQATALPSAAFPVQARMDPNGPYADMKAAVDARYAFLSAQANDSSGNLNQARLKQAADDITGGVLFHNGPLLPPYRGATQTDLDTVLSGLKPEEFKATTGAGTPVTLDYLRRSAKLAARSDGTYYVQLNGDDTNPQYAKGPDGGAYVLDLRGRRAPPRDPVAAQGIRDTAAMAPVEAPAWPAFQ